MRKVTIESGPVRFEWRRIGAGLRSRGYLQRAWSESRPYLARFAIRHDGSHLVVSRLRSLLTDRMLHAAVAIGRSVRSSERLLLMHFSASAVKGVLLLRHYRSGHVVMFDAACLDLRRRCLGKSNGKCGSRLSWS